jgi:3-hydroxyacyl-[acyl-carrier-protein] dehydratase
MKPARVGVKYCGGCREQYNRKAEFEKARGEISEQKAEFVPVSEGESYDSLLVICGCPTRCADISKYRTDGDVIMIDSKEGMNCLQKNFTEAS